MMATIDGIVTFSGKGSSLTATEHDQNWAAMAASVDAALAGAAAVESATLAANAATAAAQQATLAAENVSQQLTDLTGEDVAYSATTTVTAQLDLVNGQASAALSKSNATEVLVAEIGASVSDLSDTVSQQADLITGAQALLANMPVELAAADVARGRQKLEIYVNNVSGSDANDGTATLPLQTIAAAIGKTSAAYAMCVIYLISSGTDYAWPSGDQVVYAVASVEIRGTVAGFGLTVPAGGKLYNKSRALLLRNLELTLEYSGTTPDYWISCSPATGGNRLLLADVTANLQRSLCGGSGLIDIDNNGPISLTYHVYSSAVTGRSYLRGNGDYDATVINYNYTINGGTVTVVDHVASTTTDVTADYAACAKGLQGSTNFSGDDENAANLIVTGGTAYAWAARRLYHQGYWTGIRLRTHALMLYVDQTSGNDANDGISSAAPIKTLARLSAILTAIDGAGGCPNEVTAYIWARNAEVVFNRRLVFTASFKVHIVTRNPSSSLAADNPTGIRFAVTSATAGHAGVILKSPYTQFSSGTTSLPLTVETGPTATDAASLTARSAMRLYGKHRGIAYNVGIDGFAVTLVSYCTLFGSYDRSADTVATTVQNLRSNAFETGMTYPTIGTAAGFSDGSITRADVASQWR